MGVTDGQPVSAAVTNPAFLDANNDDTALGKINFNNISDPGVSGPEIVNAQREWNALASWTGKTINVAIGTTPTWANNQVGTPTDNLFVRADYLTALFDGTTGHTHNGSDGDGPLIPGANIFGVPFAGIVNQGITLTGVTGNSWDVSTELTGKTPSPNQTTLGVVVNAPYNLTILRDNAGAEFTDGSGNLVYGRLTESVGVWTLSFYSVVSGVETPYSFASSTDVNWYYQELYNPLISTPVYNSLFFTPSDNATADVLDATETQAGKVLLSNYIPPDIGSVGLKGTDPRVAHADHTHKGVHSIMIDGDVTQAFGDSTFKAGTGISLVWDTGKLRIDNASTNTPQYEERVITSGEALAKSLTLSFTPSDPNKVILDILEIGPQSRLSDFSVSGAVLSWSGLGMDSLPIEAGDKFRIVYWS